MPITGFVDTSRPHSAKDHIILGEIKRFRKAALTGGRPEDRVYRFRTAYVGRRRRRRALCGLIGNDEVFKAARESVTIVRSNFSSASSGRDAHSSPRVDHRCFSKGCVAECLDLREFFGVWLGD
jgi:hypothetical protein